MTVGASSTVVGRARGPLQLPRVRPVRTPILDEAWVAWVDPGTMIQPTLARGLAWIDPNEVPGLVAPRGAGAELREALAWRWIAENADARSIGNLSNRNRGVNSTPCAARSHASASHHRRPPDGVRRCQFPRLGSALDRPGRWLAGAWRFSDVAGHAVATRPIDDMERTRLGFPREGVARGLASRYLIRPKRPLSFMRNTRGRTMARFRSSRLARSF